MTTTTEYLLADINALVWDRAQLRARVDDLELELAGDRELELKLAGDRAQCARSTRTLELIVATLRTMPNTLLEAHGDAQRADCPSLADALALLIRAAQYDGPATELELERIEGDTDHGTV